MKATLESTDRIITVGAGLPARIWEGTTESGTPFLAFITHLEPIKDSDKPKFIAEMSDMKKAGEAAANYPAKLLL